jgi:GTP-binding protein
MVGLSRNALTASLAWADYNTPMQTSNPRARNQVGALSFVGSFPRDLPDLEMPEVAFAGRSNVGKSSALNCILNAKKAARVSSTPGRTQAINLFRVGHACVFADLPGYGYAKVPDHLKDEWKESIERYLSNRASLRLVVLIVDARRDPQPMDGQLLYTLTELKVPSLVLATKVDKLKRQDIDKRIAGLKKGFRLPAGQPVAFSAMSRVGRDAVWDRLEAAIGGVDGT